MMEAFPIAKFEKVQRMGSGSYGFVELYRSPFYQPNSVAVKQFLKHDEQETFKEDKSLAKLCHCNIVTYFGKYELDGRQCIVMEECTSDLERLIKGKKRGFSRGDVAFLTSQCFFGLNYLHSQGIVHRDIKANNILLKSSTRTILKIKDLVVKITDFGYSKHLVEGVSKVTMSTAGAEYYMAPEVRLTLEEKRSGKKVAILYSTRADVYSMAVVVRQMVDRILAPEDNQNVVRKDKPLQAFLTSCLQNDPEYRKKASELLEMDFIAEYKEGNITVRKDSKLQ